MLSLRERAEETLFLERKENRFDAIETFSGFVPVSP